MDYSSLPTSEALSHGMVMVVTGYVQMMATAKCSSPLLLATTLLNVVSLFIVAYFSARPISLLYMVISLLPSSYPCSGGMSLPCRRWR